VKILIYEPYAHEVYGANRHLLSLFRHVCRPAFELTLVVPLEGRLSEQLRQGGGRCLVVQPPRALARHGGAIMADGLVGRLATIVALLRQTFVLLVLLRREQPDLVQCQSIRALFTIGLAAVLARKPLFWYVNADLENPVLDRLAFWLADAIVFQAETIKNRRYPTLVKRYAAKIRIIHNGIDLEGVAAAERAERASLRRELTLREGRVNLAFVGSLCPRKGVEYLLEATARIASGTPAIRLYMIGEYCVEGFAWYKAQLDRLIEERGLADTVVFLGYRTDALEVLSLMDVYVLSSLNEGVPKSLLEAMALGKAVVATRVGGIEELVRDGEMGYLVPAGDVEALAARMRDFVIDPAARRRCGAAARRLIVTRHSIHHHIARLEELYRDLARTGRAGRLVDHAVSPAGSPRVSRPT
jgi:glycosyltransferase involved in cell wall biosynthesis